MNQNNLSPKLNNVQIFTARVNITVPLGERQKREGARKESVENSLAASSAKITSQPVSNTQSMLDALKLVLFINKARM